MESFHCFSSEPFSPDAAQSRASSGQTPVIPLPDPGEGGPVAPDIGGTPVIPLPNPGEGGPVAPGGGIGMVPGLAPLEQHPLSQRGPLLSPLPHLHRQHAGGSLSGVHRSLLLPPDGFR